MNSYDTTIENMQKLVDSYAFAVNRYSESNIAIEKEVLYKAIDALLDIAAANGMSKEELEELAEVEW